MYIHYKMKLAIAKPVITLFGKMMIAQTNLITGAGSCRQVGQLVSSQQVSKVLIVCGQVTTRLGLLDPVLESLQAANIEYLIFDQVRPDPTFTIVEAAIAVAEGNQCQAVIGFGGGSALDTAKTVAAALTNHRDVRKLKGMMKVRNHPLPFIAIPTTAGTGSEVTIVAVISDDQTHQKLTIIDPKLVASDTILDPSLLTAMPSALTATTGFDALTHGIEAYLSGYATTETNKLALKAIKLICSNLERSYNQPDNLKARQNMLLGSMFAGQAFTRTYVGYVHAFSHNIGARYGVAHGLANAVLLPHVLMDAKCEARFKLAQLSDFLELGRPEDNVDIKAQAFIDYIFELQSKLNIPKRLEAFPQDGIDEVISGAFKEAHGQYPVPKYYTKLEAQQLLRKVCARDKGK